MVREYDFANDYTTGTSPINWVLAIKNLRVLLWSYVFLLNKILNGLLSDSWWVVIPRVTLTSTLLYCYCTPVVLPTFSVVISPSHAWLCPVYKKQKYSMKKQKTSLCVELLPKWHLSTSMHFEYRFSTDFFSPPSSYNERLLPPAFPHSAWRIYNSTNE